MSHANGRPEDNTVGACCLETRFDSVMVHEWRGGRAVDCANLENWKTQKWVSGVRIPPSPQNTCIMAKEKYYKFQLVLEYVEVTQQDSAKNAKEFGLESVREMIGNGFWPNDMKVTVKRITKEEAEELEHESCEDEDDEKEDDDGENVNTSKQTAIVTIGSRIHELKKQGR